jgi:L-amino acid N-acyltransferase YncA
MIIIPFEQRHKSPLASLVREYVGSELNSNRFDDPLEFEDTINGVADFLMDEIGCGSELCHLAVDENGEVIGFATAHLYHNNASKTLHAGVVEFTGVYVPEQFRYRGIAKSLDASLIEHARSMPEAIKLVAPIKVGNIAGEKLKKSLGFRPTKETYAGEPGGMYRYFKRKV